MQEWVGYTLTPDTSQQKFLVAEGEGANGKTVFLETHTQLLGPENVSHVPLEMFGMRFQLTSTLGKLANICSEVGEIDRVAEGTLKQFTSRGSHAFRSKEPHAGRGIPHGAADAGHQQPPAVFGSVERGVAADDRRPASGSPSRSNGRTPVAGEAARGSCRGSSSGRCRVSGACASRAASPWRPSASGRSKNTAPRATTRRCS